MQYKIVVDKQSRTNPSEEKREYTIDIEELRVKGSVYDSINIEVDKTYVTRRLSLSEYGVLTELDEPIIENLDEVNIQLFEGDNYIYLVDMTGNKFYAEYLIKNGFNDVYATRGEMNTAIDQTARSIELSVNQKLEGYSTTEQMNAAIKLSAETINIEVSKKVGEDEIISKINQSAEKISINADKINIDGKAVNFRTNISEKKGPFTESDKNKAIDYILGKTTLTSEEFEKYDVNGDEEINSADTLLMVKAIQEGGYLSLEGTYQIDPYSSTKSISIYNKLNNTYSAIISLMNNYFNNLRVGRLETDIDIDTKNSSSLQSNSLFITNEENSNSVIIQLGDWFDNESTSGISITNGSADNNSSINLITHIDDAYIDLFSQGAYTEIKASGITTPTLTQTSKASEKKNFEKLNNALDLINKIDIYKYNLKTEKNTDKKHIGFVIGKGYKYRKEVTNKDNTGAEIYSLASLGIQGIKELDSRLSKLEKMLEVSK